MPLRGPLRAPAFVPCPPRAPARPAVAPSPLWASARRACPSPPHDELAVLVVGTSVGAGQGTVEPEGAGSVGAELESQGLARLDPLGDAVFVEAQAMRRVASGGRDGHDVVAGGG